MASIPTHGHNRIALGYMALAVLGYSVMPLLVALIGGENSPFLFNAGLTLGVGIGQAIFLWFAFRRVLFIPSVLALAGRRIFTYSMLLIVIHRFEYGLFALSTRFIDVSVASIIFEVWPITSLLLLAFLFRNEARYQKVTFGMLMLLGVSFCGFFFVAGSQDGDFQTWFNSGLTDTLVGLGIILLAVLIATLVSFTFRWGQDFRDALPQEVVNKENTIILEISCVIVASCIGAMISSGLNFAVGFGIGETISSGTLIAAVLGGAIAYAVANITWRAANMLTDNLGINALSYSTPLVALLWLYIFSQVGVARVDALIIGAAAIISTNLLINFEAEIRMGYKALVVAIWGLGAFIYMRDELLPFLPFEGWLWPGEPFLGVLGLSATVFTLLLSFRVARLAARTQDEDNMIFVVFQELDYLIRRGLIDGSIRQQILEIDASHSPSELQTAYWQAKSCISKAVEFISAEEDLARLARVEAQLNTIVHSRRHGIEFGEIFALIIFGGITVSFGLFSRPRELSDWAGFMFEVFAICFSAVIVYLITDVWDLHRDRTSYILEQSPETGEYGIRFRDARNRGFEQGVSILIGIVITAFYVGLLWQKWLPGNTPMP